jgi:hypothetical protein
MPTFLEREIVPRPPSCWRRRTIIRDRDHMTSQWDDTTSGNLQQERAVLAVRRVTGRVPPEMHPQAITPEMGQQRALDGRLDYAPAFTDRPREGERYLDLGVCHGQVRHPSQCDDIEAGMRVADAAERTNEGLICRWRSAHRRGMRRCCVHLCSPYLRIARGR